MKKLFIACSVSLLLLGCNSSSSEEEVAPILPIETPTPIEDGIQTCLGLEEKFTVSGEPVDDFYVIFYQDGQEPFRLNYKQETAASRWVIYLDGEHSNAFVDIFFNNQYQRSMPIENSDNGLKKSNATFIQLDHQEHGVVSGWSNPLIDIETECVDVYPDEIGGVL